MGLFDIPRVHRASVLPRGRRVEVVLLLHNGKSGSPVAGITRACRGLKLAGRRIRRRAAAASLGF